MVDPVVKLLILRPYELFQEVGAVNFSRDVTIILFMCFVYFYESIRPQISVHGHSVNSIPPHV